MKATRGYLISPGGEDGEVELPENDYRVICFNYDTDGMVWKENGSYTLFTADTRDVRSPDNRTMAVTPPLACVATYRQRLSSRTFREEARR